MTLIVGHRAVGVKETRLESFQAALDLGLEMIEFDLRLTADKQLVVFHGPPGMEGRNILRDKTLVELEQELGFSPPRFSEVVELCSDRLAFDIELKEADILPLVTRALPNPAEHLFTSFLDSVVFEARESGLRAGLVLGMSGIGLKQRLSELFPAKRKAQTRADLLLPKLSIYRFSPQRSRFANCIIWGVDQPEDITAALDDQRVAGIITDYPGMAHQIRDRRPAR